MCYKFFAHRLGPTAFPGIHPAPLCLNCSYGKHLWISYSKNSVRVVTNVTRVRFGITDHRRTHLQEERGYAAPAISCWTRRTRSYGKWYVEADDGSLGRLQSPALFPPFTLIGQFGRDNEEGHSGKSFFQPSSFCYHAATRTGQISPAHVGKIVVHGFLVEIRCLI